jgi:hypothetical protein
MEEQMKRSIASLALLIALLSACGPQRGPFPFTQATPSGLPVELTPAQRAAISALGDALQLPPDRIKVLSTEALTWRDGCMGVQRIGVLCAQGIVPGFRIALLANGTQYEFHTNQDGSVVVPVEGMAVPGPAAQVAAGQLAANLGLQEGEVSVISSSAVEWPDSCLGVALEGISCAYVVTPGYLILLSAQGRLYEYHTDEDAGRIIPGTLALTWKQQGGIAGFCQGLTVYLSGEVYSLDCRAGPDGRMGVLTTEERQQLYDWIDGNGVAILDASDPQGVADGMTRLLDLYGSGIQQPSSADQALMFGWAQALYARVNQ